MKDGYDYSAQKGYPDWKVAMDQRIMSRNVRRFNGR